MKHASFLVLLFLMPAVFSSPAGAADVVARVGGTEVTTDEVRAYLDTLPEADQAVLARNPAALTQVVRQYLTRQQVLKEARDRKFDQQAETKAKLEQVRDTALLELYLQSVAKLPEAFPSDAELQVAYDANKTAFLAPRQYRLAQIFVAAPKGNKDAEEKAQAKLEQVQKKLRGRGADFAATAKDFSDADPDKGGDLGWLPEPQIIPEIRQEVTGLDKGGVSDPIRLDDGWHILKMIDTKPAGTMPLAEVKDMLRERLRHARAGQLRQAYLAKLASQNPPAINELALTKLLPKTK